MSYGTKELPVSLRGFKDKCCHYCGGNVVGRRDKKFCGDYCRGAYNNELKSAANNYIRNVNHVLGKNRRILETFLGNENSIKVSKEKLQQQGYNFKYSTHQFTATTAKTYIYCYEYGYLALENNWMLIIREKV